MTLGLALVPLAGAGVPSNPNCFGQSAAQFGQAGVMGEHSSSFPTPRIGIGNVAFMFTGTHQPGQLAGLLGRGLRVKRAISAELRHWHSSAGFPG